MKAGEEGGRQRALLMGGTPSQVRRARVKVQPQALSGAGGLQSGQGGSTRTDPAPSAASHPHRPHVCTDGKRQ